MARTLSTPAPADVPLTPSELVFAREYMVDLNGTRAYRVAFPGVTLCSARVLACRLLAKVNVRAEIRAARRAQARRTRVAADKVIRELARVAFAGLIDLFDNDGELRPVRDVPLETRHAITGVKVSRERVTRRTTRNGKTTTTVTVRESVIEYKFANKLDALAKLFEHLGLSTPITPLDALLLALPAALAAQLRAGLTAPAGPRV